jgi:hypothetical protein
MTSKKQPDSTTAAAQASDKSADSRLDEALEESFPASDPIAVDMADPHHAPEKGASAEEKKRH